MCFQKAKRKGQCLIETALVFPIIILLTFGIIEFSRFFWVTNAVSNASREGARIAVVTPDLSADDGRIKEAVERYLKNSMIGTEQLQVTNTEVTQGGEIISVSVSLPYQWLTPFPNFLSRKEGPPLIKRETAMTYEGSPEEVF